MIRALKNRLCGRSVVGRDGETDPIVRELARKLWSGFSRCARIDLDEIVSGCEAGTRKSWAAWELARFCAFEGKWPDALGYLEVTNEASRDFRCCEAVGALYIEALIGGGRTQEAEHCARRLIGRWGGDRQLRWALSNAIAASPCLDKQADPDSLRLALLNSAFRLGKVSEVRLVDPSRGFTFGNLDASHKTLPRLDHSAIISILISVSTADPAVPVAVSSILNQTWRNIEVLIVDDAGTHETGCLVQRLAREDSRIVDVAARTEPGIEDVRSRAASIARGDLIAVHDGHLWAHPQMLHTQVKAMLESPNTKLVLSQSACVSPEMRYSLRVNQDDTAYVWGTDRSYLVSKSVIQNLGGWNSVPEYADEEFVARARTIYGYDAVRAALPGVPLSLFIERFAGLAESTRFQTSTYRVRREYLRQARFSTMHVIARHRDRGRDIVDRKSINNLIPVPVTVPLRDGRRKRHYDLVVISDLSLLGGTRRCNEGYIAAARNLGMKVGMFHWPRYDLSFRDDIAKEYRILRHKGDADILAEDERVRATLVLVHHPPIMSYLPDEFPKIDLKKLAILVNQLPQRFGEGAGEYYQRESVEFACAKLFGMAPVWIPISPLVRRVLLERGYTRLAEEDWIPPLGNLVRSTAGHARARRGNPVIGRHGRDHVTKWPEAEGKLRAAWCADSNVTARFLGGATFARKVLARWPGNWEELEFDCINVNDFVRSLDFLVHFTHSTYVEEFGRNVMEAMAAGVPTVVSPALKEVFGDAACYAEPERVEELIDTLWRGRSAYAEQTDKGTCFVEEFAGSDRVERRIQQAIEGSI